MKLSLILQPQMNGQIKRVNQVSKQYLQCTTNYFKKWSIFLAMAEFAYNNIMHSLTQQTPLFVNHCLHPKFNIQGVHKVVNPVVED
jgi:hypothetical protein